MTALREVIESGMPESRNDLPSDLHTTDGIIVYKDRIVIPPTLRGEVLTALHAAHQGVSSMITKAEASVFWPGITSDINNIRNTCQACNYMSSCLSVPVHMCRLLSPQRQELSGDCRSLYKLANSRKELVDKGLFAHVETV